MIFRIDVDKTRPGLNYDIPDDNPFVGNLREFREEIYAYGLRNPWPSSFDSATQWLWAADVGQNAYEEIDIIEKGKNYGWNIMEGFHCYNASSCDTVGLTMPIWEYSHSVGQSIIGGYVYRGFNVPELIGKYIYADYVSGRIWALEYSGDGEPTNSLLKDTDLNIASFGVDHNNELYICAFDGNIYRFKEATTNVLKSNLIKFDNFRLAQNFPNPFNSSTVISYNLKKAHHVNLEIYNTLGQLIKRLVNADQSAGNQSVVWNGDDINDKKVASGIYIYKLTMAGLQKTKKMLYLP